MKQTTKEFKYDLTIGMIFRNDIQFIRKCLESMMPLREALNCQLIMTDTGSVDGSREVAEEYADILLDFEWCDDFSAARNTGTSIAEGRWFAYFDCDQEFDESILEIAKFLKSKESDKEDCLIFEIRDYNYWGNYDDYSCHASSHVYNCLDGLRLFEGIVHETIKRNNQGKTLPTVIHHWGHSTEIKREKLDRNRPLIEKIIRDNPEDLKNWQQYISQLEDQFQKSESAKQGYEYVKASTDPTSDFYRISIPYQGFKAAFKTNSWEQCEHFQEIIEENLKKHCSNTMIELEYLFTAVTMSFNRKQPKETLEFYDRYKTLFLYLEKNPNCVTKGIFPFEHNSEDSLHTLEVLAMKIAFSENEFNEIGVSLLEKSKAYEFSQKKGNSPLYFDFVQLVFQNKVFRVLPALYKFLLPLESEQLTHLQHLIDKTLHENTKDETKESLLKIMTQDVVDSFTALLSIKKKHFTEQAYTKKNVAFITDEEDFHLKPLNSHLFYGYLLTGIDPLCYIDKNEISICIKYFDSLDDTYKNCVELVEKAYYDPEFSINSLKYEKLWCYLGMRSLLRLSEVDNDESDDSDTLESETNETNKSQLRSMDVERINKLYSQVIPMMYNYVNKVYNPYLLSEEGRGVVPPEELFSVYAMDALNAQNPLDMVRKLKAAMDVCPSYGPIIKVFLSQLQNTQENTEGNSVPAGEMSDLSKQIKGTIKTLLGNGEKEQAKTFLDKYKAINPDDPEIPELLAQLEN